MSERRYFFAGLPESGKSSLLAAFWVYTNGNASNAAFSVSAYPDDAKYFDSLQVQWLRYIKVPRTQESPNLKRKLELMRKSDGAKFILQIPDLSGEIFTHIWEQRHWPDEIEEMLGSSDGALFFVDPTVVEGLTIRQQNEVAAVLDEDAVKADGNPVEQVKESDDASTSASGKDNAEEVPRMAKRGPNQFNPENVPTQIKIVEFLQLFAESGRLKKPFRLGLVISAWDRIVAHSPKIAPEKWLLQNLPLLSQFLETNTATFEAAVFGVSAQGGDYEKQTELASLKERSTHQRCRVVGRHVSDETDITAPIQWLTMQ